MIAETSQQGEGNGQLMPVTNAVAVVTRIVTIKKVGYNEQINNSLKEVFGKEYSEAAIFKNRSKYIVIEEQGEIAALVRLAESPDCVFASWASRVLNTSNALELSSCMVNPLYRGGLFYDLLITCAFKYAQLSGYRFVNGTAVVNRQRIDRLAEYGFSKAGEPVRVVERDGAIVQMQAYTIDLFSCQPIWNDVFAQCCAHFERNGYVIEHKLG